MSAGIFVGILFAAVVTHLRGLALGDPHLKLACKENECRFLRGGLAAQKNDTDNRQRRVLVLQRALAYVEEDLRSAREEADSERAARRGKDRELERWARLEGRVGELVLELGEEVLWLPRATRDPAAEKREAEKALRNLKAQEWRFDFV